MAAIVNPKLTAWGEMPGKPEKFPPAAHTHIISDIDGLQTALNGKMPYRREDTYEGTTNANGLFAVVYATPFPKRPHVSLSFVGATTEQNVRLVSSSETGFTAHAFARGGLSVLGLTLLALATTNVSGAPITATVTAL